MNIFTDHDNEILMLHRRVGDLQTRVKALERAVNDLLEWRDETFDGMLRIEKAINGTNERIDIMIWGRKQ